ncbi:MAG TPA: hypothetical protein D7I11_06125 [Candidatus Poseidoniales archaeon]|nr:hypothetical protein [Euryarchaeota archaeon]DAC53689.1 MAG TPA: hypothetical protein D7I11_06125 [Candidatus Poseidoniales archaeon]HII27990.1 hypothetical protein [Poseidonia sp.]
MSWAAAAFAPRKDHKGMSTPSYAARWWLPICTGLCAVWSWQAADGVVVMAAALTMMVATPLLSVGWYLIGLVSARVPSRYIIPQAERAHKARLERKAQQASQNDSA